MAYTMDVAMLRRLFETELTNAKIAVMTGLSAERVRQLRKRNKEGTLDTVRQNVRGRPLGARNRTRDPMLPEIPYGTQLPDELTALLGKVPDKTIAKQFGRSVSWVVQLRKKQGIGSCRSQVRAEITPHLGSDLSDSALAEKFGVSRLTINKLRRPLRKKNAED